MTLEQYHANLARLRFFRDQKINRLNEQMRQVYGEYDAAAAKLLIELRKSNPDLDPWKSL